MTAGGKVVELTVTEYELLRVLSLDAGRVVTFETLLRRVWAKDENANANLVRNFVRNLRRKLGDSAPAPPTCSTSAASATAWRSRRTTRNGLVAASARSVNPPRGRGAACPRLLQRS